MTLKVRIGLSEGFEILIREKSLERENRVKSGRAVTFGENESVPVLPLRILGVNIHLMKIEISHNINAGKRAAGMTRFGVENALDYSHSRVACLDF
jgi:hypothetical protein